MKTEAAFWDTSAIVPLGCHQTASLQARLLRDGEITPREFQQAIKRLAALEPSW